MREIGRRGGGEVRMNGEIWKGKSKCELRRKGKKVKRDGEERRSGIL